MKILILRLSSLGDIVLTQPIAAFLRARFPNAKIDFVVKAQYAPLVSLMACELRAIPYSKSRCFHHQIHKERYDLVIDLHGKLSSFLIRLFAAGKRSAVYQKKRSIRKKIIKGNPDLAISSTLDLYNSALQKLGFSARLEAPRLFPTGSSPIPKSSAKRIVIFPGATYYTKRYPLSYYKELIEISPPDWEYIILGSAQEHEMGETLASDSRVINLCGQLSFDEILALLNTADWVISSDSGPMHLAAALERPQIAIFGSTHPRLGFAPQNPNAKIIAQDLPCQPCSLHGFESCPLGHFDCMMSIAPQTILAMLMSS